MADERAKGAAVKRGTRKKPTEAAPVQKAPRPSGCRRFARARLAEAMPSLVGTLIEQSQGGSLAHMKLLVQLSGLDEAPPAAKDRKKRADNTVRELIDEWRAGALERTDNGTKTS